MTSEVSLRASLASLGGLLKKATNLLGLASGDERPVPLDGEIIYCKNNVCVHLPAVLSSQQEEHHPGYLNIRSQDDQVLGSTLILTWIPNSALRKNPRSIENSPMHGPNSPRRSPRQDFSPCTQITSPLTPSGDEYGERRTASNPTVHKSCESETPDDSGLIKSPQSTMSSSSVSPSTESQLRILTESAKRRLDSTQSVASIDMEGENLTVVTEDQDKGMADDDVEADKVDLGTEENGENIVQEKNIDAVPEGLTASCENFSVSSDSTFSSPSSDHYPRMLRELTAAATKSNVSEESSDVRSKDNDVIDKYTCVEPEGTNDDHGASSQLIATEVEQDELTEENSAINDHQESSQQISTDNNYQMSNDDDVESIPANTEHAQMSTDELRGRLHLELNPRLTTQLPTSPDIVVSNSPGESSSSTSGPDSDPPSPITPPPMPSYTPESLPETHNLMFPHNSVSYGACSMQKSAKEQLCGVFSVDLGEMRSLRIFYSDDRCSCGQLVIASRESQYKVLHFHHGGLDKLYEGLTEWKFLAQAEHKKTPEGRDAEMMCRQFSVIRPYLGDSHRHPEEGAYERVTEDTWKQHMNQDGQIEDDHQLKKAVFFAGLDPSLRHEMWPFLLHYYPYNSTFEQREQIRNDKYIEYQNIRQLRDKMSDDELRQFWRSIQCTVEKDVVRTDRSHPYFSGENNPHLEVLKNILLNYAAVHPHYGYSQGMSDLLAPVLVEVQNEVDTYWCFVGLMQKTIFVSSPNDIDMDKQLDYLRELLRVMLPHFYKHLQKVQDGMELLFCHRWILLCFKREFAEWDALMMWEACWSHYQTDYFHLFVAVAIIAVYGEDVVQQQLAADEMLLHFSSLSMHMSADVVLKKARGLLHQFRTLPSIPCSLSDLCVMCGPGMWDNGYMPVIKCTGSHKECPCSGSVG